MRIGKKFYIGAASVFVAAGAFVGLLSLTSTSADAMTITDRRDCGYTDPIIDCGTTSTEELLRAYDRNDDGRGNKDVQAIFNYYGVTRSVITNTTAIKKGWLDHQTGTITVDGQIVGTNAQSLYRVNVPGKNLSPVSIGGKTYYIGNVAGQYSKGADVFVFYKNGQPYMAIQGSCGNPIPFTPKEQPKPIYTCDSLKATKIKELEYSFAAAATAKNNAKIVSYTYDFGDGNKSTTPNASVVHTYAKAGTYTVRLSVTFNVNGETKVVDGANCQTTIKIEEAPKTPIYTCDSLKYKKISRLVYGFETATTAKDGAKVVSYTYDYGDGKKETVKTASVTHEYAKAGTYTIKVSVTFDVNGETKVKNGTSCQTTIKIDEAPKTPIYTCDSLRASRIKEKEFSFETTTTAKDGAKVVSYTYDYGDGKKETVPNAIVKHTYANVGTYTVKVVVTFNVNGETKTKDGAQCQTTVKAEDKPVTPMQKCDKLTAQLINSDTHTYRYTVTYSTEGDVTLNKVTYNFGDNTSKTQSGNGMTTVDHSYAAAGTYTTTATLYFTVKENGKAVEKSSNCTYAVTIPAPENCPLPGKESFPKNSPECTPCDIPGKENLPKDSPECVETPPELPHTGVDTFIGGGIGLGSLTAAGYYFVASRKNLLSALLNK